MSAPMDEVVRSRVLRCAADAGIDPDHLGDIVPSWSNHAVAVNAPERAFLRVCWIGNRCA
ncbi:hypothetical protein [Aestuariimicrobium ganziense]|uniref:hypothetical protein n=1 Tax=Aestuariimicrobium ganziense TaxID=2773677 RepID=UPI00194229CB|nr:hypothetical protein [Aestuariimicrobium ganziense]